MTAKQRPYLGESQNIIFAGIVLAGSFSVTAIKYTH